jgi:hypothetical protein
MRFFPCHHRGDCRRSACGPAVKAGQLNA